MGMCVYCKICEDIPGCLIGAQEVAGRIGTHAATALITSYVVVEGF